MALSDDVSRIAEAAARFAAPDETVGAVIAVEPSSGERVYLCAFSGEDGTHSWLALDDAGAPVRDRTRIRDAASIAALVEVAEEANGSTRGLGPRLASPSYLDSLGAGAVTSRCVAGALRRSMN